MTAKSKTVKTRNTPLGKRSRDATTPKKARTKHNSTDGVAIPLEEKNDAS